MHSRKLIYVLRYVSIIIISLVVILYIILNNLMGNIVQETGDAHPRTKYEYGASPSDSSIPGFTYNLESLFPGQLIPAVVETENLSESISSAAALSFQFVGLIETDEKKIYSFRNIDTNRLLLLEEGMNNDGFILLAVERSPAGIGGEEVFIIKKQGHTFQVDKK